MAIKTIDVYAYGFEQGTISDGEPTWSANRVRSVNYIPLPATFVDRKLTASATVSTGKTVQVDMVGFVTTSPPDTFDLCWYDSPYTFDLSSYQTTMYFKMCLKYSDNTTIAPSEITSCKVTYDDGSIYHAHEGEYPVNDSAMPIVQTDFTRPFPSNLWRIDESNDGYPYHDLQLGILYKPLYTGAFEESSALTKVKIPPTVKVIGERAFTGTALTEVTIASDCTYYGTSFPQNCVINIYPE